MFLSYQKEWVYGAVNAKIVCILVKDIAIVTAVVDA
jgi:hypothetical protein